MAWLKKPTWRLAVVYTLMAGLFAFACPSAWSLAIGVPPILAGQALRLWACGHLVKNKRLTTTGPYAYVKNPLYVGTILMSTGFCVASRRWELLALVILGFYLYYMPRKKQIEGDRLRQIYGEAYTRFDENVPDLLPRLTPYRSGDATRFDLRLVFDNSEHGTFLSMIAGFALMALSVYLRREGLLTVQLPWAPCN